MRERIGAILPGLEPHEELFRKYKEYALLTLFMEDTGTLGEETEALSVAAGRPWTWIALSLRKTAR